MKSTLITLFIGLFLSFIFVCNAGDSQTNFTSNRKISAPIYKEIILQIENVNEKNLSEIRKNIEISEILRFPVA